MTAWLASPRIRRLPAPGVRWLAALVAAAALLLLLPAEGMAGAALRALGLLGALAAGAAALRRPAAPARPVALLDRQPLGGGAGVALVEAGGRRLLLGYGPSGVSLLGDLGNGGRP